MDLSSKSKIPRFNFLLNCKRKNCWIWTSNQIKNVKRRCDIVFLSEIFTNSYMARTPKFYVDLNFWTFIYVSVLSPFSMYSQCIGTFMIFGFCQGIPAISSSVSKYHILYTLRFDTNKYLGYFKFNHQKFSS